MLKVGRVWSLEWSTRRSGRALKAQAEAGAVIVISNSCVAMAIVTAASAAVLLCYCAAVCVAAFEIAPKRTIKHEVFMCRRAS